MSENELAKIIVDKCFKIHKGMGPGLFESVYEEILYYELKKTGLAVERQKPIAVYWDNLAMDIGFKADIVVEDKVILELKSVTEISKVYQKQLLTYLRLTEIKLGLLINFNEELIKDGIQRIVNRL